MGLTQSCHSIIIMVGDPVGCKYSGALRIAREREVPIRLRWIRFRSLHCPVRYTGDKVDASEARIGATRHLYLTGMHEAAADMLRNRLYLF